MYLPLHYESDSETNPQGRILAVWILAPKLPNSDLKIAVDFWVDFFLLSFPRKKDQKNPEKKIPRKIHPGLCSEKFPSDFCRSLLLTNPLIFICNNFCADGGVLCALCHSYRVIESLCHS